MPETKMSNRLTVEKKSDALIITFNQPEIRSPLSISVLESLIECLNETATDAQIRTIVFTGSEDVFASGADLREIAAVKPETAREFATRGQKLMKAIADSAKLTVAAVNGFCFGGALDLALACDKRIASESATFAHPGVSLGIITGWGGTQRLPRLVGEAKALEIFLTAERISAQAALKIKLIDFIADDPLAYSLANYSKDSTS